MEAPKNFIDLLPRGSFAPSHFWSNELVVWVHLGAISMGAAGHGSPSLAGFPCLAPGAILRHAPPIARLGVKVSSSYAGSGRRRRLERPQPPGWGTPPLRRGGVPRRPQPPGWRSRPRFGVAVPSYPNLVAIWHRQLPRPHENGWSIWHRQLPQPRENARFLSLTNTPPACPEIPGNTVYTDILEILPWASQQGHVQLRAPGCVSERLARRPRLAFHLRGLLAEQQYQAPIPLRGPRRPR